MTKTFFSEICLAKNEIAFNSLRADCISFDARLGYLECYGELCF